jgi:hypothetical protein
MNASARDLRHSVHAVQICTSRLYLHTAVYVYILSYNPTQDTNKCFTYNTALHPQPHTYYY